MVAHMANLKGTGAMNQRDLIVSYQESQLYTNDKGRTTAFLTVQLDQSTMTQKDAKAGKADSNPYLNSNSVEGKDGDTFVSHTVPYTKGQLDTIEAAGTKVVQKDGTIAIAIKANIQVMGATGSKREPIIMLPKDENRAKDETELAKIKAYNEKNPVGKSGNTKFGVDSLAKQAKITGLAKAARVAELEALKAPEATAEKAVEAEAEC